MSEKSTQFTERWCDCFQEFYSHSDDHEEDITKFLAQKKLELGESKYDEFCDHDGFEQLLRQEFSFKWRESQFHRDKNTESDRAWDIVQDVFDRVARHGNKKLILSEHMDREDYKALNTLPASIANLKDLRELVIYRSQISFLPREIMHCENLQVFTPYTSWRLHWLPYEITNCPLKSTTISTRVLYGNYKLRPPFPNVKDKAWLWRDGKEYCSVCFKECDDLDQYWISQVIGTDIVPLLASVCGFVCLSALGDPANGYVPYPHQGGPLVTQPETRY